MRLKEPQGRIRWINRQTAERLMEEAASVRGYLPDFIRLALNTGMRKGEILGLSWDRVDLEQRMVYLTDQDQKNGKHGSIPLNDDAVEALERRLEFREQYCPQSPWVFSKRDGTRVADIKKGFKTACERAGIHNFNPHDLRHTFAAWLVQAGVPIREVADLLRHSDIRMTMRYAHLAPNNVRAAVDRLSQFRPTMPEKAGSGERMSL